MTKFLTTALMFLFAQSIHAANLENLAVQAQDFGPAGLSDIAVPPVTGARALEGAVKSVRQADYQFEIKPLPTAPSSRADIEKSLLNLYKNDIPAELLENEIVRSQEFQEQVYATLNAQISQNKNWPVSITERRLTGNFVKETTVRFPSLIQRPNGHASNTVVARIYEPAVQDQNCDIKYPATIMLHHILNEVEIIEDAAKVISPGIIAKPAVVVVLHMPHYGLRRQGNEQFLTSNMADFRKNMLQLILDVHMLRNYLETRENVDTKNISLSGISLGSVLGLTVGAFDQGFSKYGYLVGGVDTADILMNRVRTSPDSEVAVALRDLHPDEGALRNELASSDGMTWLHRYQGKKMFILSASRDNIVDYNNSVVPMLKLLKEQGNDVTHRLNDDTHSPSGSALKKLQSVFLPLIRFIVEKTSGTDAYCPATPFMAGY